MSSIQREQTTALLILTDTVNDKEYLMRRQKELTPDMMKWTIRRAVAAWKKKGGSDVKLVESLISDDFRTNLVESTCTRLLPGFQNPKPLHPQWDKV
jgi:hypothetical protein